LANNGALYGIIGALAVVVVGGGLYIAKEKGAFDGPVPTTAAVPPPAPTPAPIQAPAPSPPVAAMPQPAPPPVATGPTTGQAQFIQQLVGDARRAISRGKFDDAERALDQAERIDPRSSDVLAARRDLREAQQRTQRQDNHQDNHVDALVAQARAAIARHDYPAADRLLDQAERIDSRDRDVQQARAELTAAQRPGSAPAPDRR
jgi:tetratricopeptide (TPR) repeat protein